MLLQPLIPCRPPCRSAGPASAIPGLWPTLAVTVLACVLASACAEGEPAAATTLPRDGRWTGPELSFFYQGGTLSELEFVPQTCTGEGACTAKAGGPVAQVFAAGWTLTLRSSPGAGQAGVEVDGSFGSAVAAHGTFRLQPPGATVGSGGCCVVTGAWTANHVPGSEPSAADAGSLANGENGQGVAGSPTWGGASTGSVHPGPATNAPALATPSGATAAQSEALKRLNALRAAVGVAAAVEDAAINTAAQAHAEFYVTWATKYTAKNLSPHEEDASFGAGFTGKSFADRMQAAGFKGSPSGEVMAFSGSTEGALQGWLDTVYHRLPLVDPGTGAFGYGEAAKGGKVCEVMNFAAGGKGNGPIVVYPWPGQTGIPPSWNGLEGPQPPKPPKGYPSGPVVTARFPWQVAVQAHTLTAADGAEVPHVWLDDDNDPNLASFDTQTKVLYAHKPLAAGVYKVRIAFTHAGKAETLVWRFTVGP